MKLLISIGAIRKVESLQKRLDLEAHNLENWGIKFVLNSVKVGELTLLQCNLRPILQTMPNQELMIRYYLARVISDFIVTEWELPLLNKIVNQHHNLVAWVERDQITQRAKKILDLTDLIQEDKTVALVANSNRRNWILKEVFHYLETNNELIIDGFLRFRLKKYLNQLRQAVDLAIDEVQQEKEYQEFIHLLRYFVQMQEPQVSQAHVILRPNGIFHIFDAQGKPVENEYQDSFLLEVVDNELNYEDLLLSALITLAPQQITLHTLEIKRYLESIGTIQRVFGGRVEICRGCERCQEQGQPYN